jgi:hypothetical protein
MKISLAALLVSLTLVASPASAMRCGRLIVDKGNTAAEVLSHCGSPQTQETIRETKPDGSWIEVEQWVYDQGPRYFPQILIIQGGIVRSIESGSRH